MKDIPLSGIIKNQASIIIGCVGHVSHGKSTIVKNISKKSTLRHSSERKKNSSINLGYANCKIYKSINSHNYYCSDTIKNKDDVLIKHVSFVDCPGHESYIANMLNGSTLMDYVFLVVDSTDNVVLQKQAEEHITCLLLGDMDKITCLQNKIDLISHENCKENMHKIKNELKDKFDLNIDIIPISAQFDINMNIIKHKILQYNENISNKINSKVLLPIVRSFDINNPGTNPLEIKGGIIGGSLINGYLRKDNLVEIRPGIYDNKNNICKPIIAKIINIKSGDNNIDIAFPGGLIGIELNIDPYLTKSNKLVGQLLGEYNKMPELYKIIKLKIKNLKRMEKRKIIINEVIKIHSLSYFNFGKIIEYNKEKKEITIDLLTPICINNNTFVSVFRSNGSKYTLSHIGKLLDCDPIKVEYEEGVELIQNEKEEFNIINDIEKYSLEIDSNYDKLLENKITNDIVKLKLPSSKVKSGTKYTEFYNFKNILETLIDISDNDIDELTKYFINYIKQENCGYYSIEDYIILFKKKIKNYEINNLIKNFIKSYIKCNICNNYKTSIIREERLDWIKCANCNGKYFIQ